MLSAYPLPKCSWPFLLSAVALLSGLTTLIITILYRCHSDSFRHESASMAWREVHIYIYVTFFQNSNLYLCSLGFSTRLGHIFNQGFLDTRLPTNDLAVSTYLNNSCDFIHRTQQFYVYASDLNHLCRLGTNIHRETDR
jgi:hypothetical protein